MPSSGRAVGALAEPRALEDAGLMTCWARDLTAPQPCWLVMPFQEETRVQFPSIQSREAGEIICLSILSAAVSDDSNASRFCREPSCLACSRPDLRRSAMRWITAILPLSYKMKSKK